MDIRGFVLEALEISGAAFREVKEDLIMAEVTVEIPPLFFDPPRLKKQTLNLVFDPEAAGRYPGAELVTRNSPRLQWFVAGLKKRGRLTLQTLVYDPAVAGEKFRTCRPDLSTGGSHLEYSEIFRPWLLVNYVVARYADRLWEEPISLGIDMSSGRIHEGFFALLKKAGMRPGVPSGQIARQVIPLEKAFALLRGFLAKKIAAADRSWYENARRCYEEELFCLYRYYHEKTGVSSLNPEFIRKAKELHEQFRPRVEVRPVNFGLIYLPEFLYTTKKGAFCFCPLLEQVRACTREEIPSEESTKEIPGKAYAEKNPGEKSSEEIHSGKPAGEIPSKEFISPHSDKG
ncbi:MAG: hypothetical protein GX085_00015 [Firmicutes bacterium]|nr:hypothetical protein [Bacillota bacterium]